jgi:creatinine deaminase
MDYQKLISVAPEEARSGLIHQFNIGTVVGESVNFSDGVDWLRQNGVNVIDLHSSECIAMMSGFIREHAALWNEDIGEE